MIVILFTYSPTRTHTHHYNFDTAPSSNSLNSLLCLPLALCLPNSLPSPLHLANHSGLFHAQAASFSSPLDLSNRTLSMYAPATGRNLSCVSISARGEGDSKGIHEATNVLVRMKTSSHSNVQIAQLRVWMAAQQPIFTGRHSIITDAPPTRDAVFRPLRHRGVD